jgi:hypothetical protein
MAARPQFERLRFVSRRSRSGLSSMAARASEFVMSRLAPPISDRLVRPDRLHAALHGRAVTVSGQSWRLEVYSIIDCAGRRWVQLALDGDPHYMLTLNLAIGAGAQLALMALVSCLANPSDAAAAIVNVA